MGLKGLLGLCECKGCKNSGDYEMDIIRHLADGKKLKKTMKICKTHAIEATKNGKVKSITFEDTINFDQSIRQRSGKEVMMNECENLASTSTLNWKDDYNVLIDKLNYEKEKHYQEVSKLKSDLKRCKEKLKVANFEKEIYKAKVDVVELIFGK